MATLNYDAITALTNRKYIPKLIDNIFRSNPLLYKLKEREETYDGGWRIVEPLIMGELGGVTSYTLYDAITYDISVPITAAEFIPRNIVAPLIISKDEELQNTGEVQILSLLRAKMQILEETLKRRLTTMIYGDGTGNAGKDITGLAAMVSDSGTYGGIPRATFPWWRARVAANAGVPRAITEALMMRMFMGISDGPDQPDLIICGPATWIEWHNAVAARVTIMTEEVQKMHGLGFQTIAFMGKPFVADLNCPEGMIYFLNTKYFKWRPHSQANFATTSFRPDDTRMARKQEILVTGNITCNQSRRFGVIRDITHTVL